MTEDKNPYEAPESNVVNNSGLPEAFIASNLSSKKLFWAGCLSLAMIVIDVGTYILSFISNASGGESYTFEYIICSLITVGASIYLLTIFKCLLQTRFNFFDANKYITLLIAINIISLVLIMLSASGNESVRNTIGITYFLFLCPIGVIATLFGIKLLKIPAQYPGLKFYAWSNIVAGICYAVIILYMAGFLVGLLANIPFALMMFTASAEAERR